MQKLFKGIFFLFAAATTACGGAETTGDVSGTGASSASGGASGTGGSTSTGGGVGTGTAADKFAGTWEASNLTFTGTCEQGDAPSFDLVPQADGTVTFDVEGCSVPLLVNGNVAQLAAPVTCGPGTYEDLRIELTSGDAGTISLTGSINLGELSCTSTSTGTLTRVDAQP